jgi:hypothetical protein
VIVSVPSVNPFAVVTAALLSVATPPVTAAVPKVTVPFKKVTLPVMIPAVVEATDAVSVVAPPSVTEAGVAVSVVVVAGGAVTVIFVLPAEVA